jgi:hypothetical protein
MPKMQKSMNVTFSCFVTQKPGLGTEIPSMSTYVCHPKNYPSFKDLGSEKKLKGFVPGEGLATLVQRTLL